MKRSLATLLLAGCGMAGFSQSFQNLGFETGFFLNPNPPHSVPFSNSLPGWQAVGAATFPGFGLTNLTLGPVSRAYYDSSDLDQMTIGIYDLSPISGAYTAWVEADLGSMHTGVVELYQSGLVPVAAHSLRFTTTSYSTLAGAEEQMSLRVNGTTIPFVPTLVQGNLTTWAADIAPYANTISEVRFAFRADYPFAGYDPHVFVGIGLDGIAFSPSPVPEPGVGWLIVAGMAAKLVFQRRGAGGTNQNDGSER